MKIKNVVILTLMFCGSLTAQDNTSWKFVKEMNYNTKFSVDLSKKKKLNFDLTFSALDFDFSLRQKVRWINGYYWVNNKTKHKKLLVGVDKGGEIKLFGINDTLYVNSFIENDEVVYNGKKINHEDAFLFNTDNSAKILWKNPKKH